MHIHILGCVYHRQTGRTACPREPSAKTTPEICLFCWYGRSLPTGRQISTHTHVAQHEIQKNTARGYDVVHPTQYGTVWCDVASEWLRDASGSSASQSSPHACEGT